MLRQITKEDRQIFLKMTEEFYNSPAVLHNIPKEYMQRTFEQITSNSPYVEGYIITTDDGSTAGYVLIVNTYSNEAGGMVAWIDELYISEEFRGRGLGSGVLRELIQKFEGAALIRLEAEKENVRAIKLYKSFGFKPLEYLQFIKE